MPKLLESAIWYYDRGFSIIPMGSNKRPMVKWVSYQKERASKSEIEEWWTKNPNASIGIITGKISGVTVIDLDSQEAINKIEELWPDNLITPIASSPSGGQHRYFKYDSTLKTVSGVLPKTDIRSDGGIIIAPPSKNGRGNYAWLDGLKISDIELNIIPNSIKTLILNNNIYKGSDIKRHQAMSMLFEKGGRDNTIFHIANCLTKGGMSNENIEQLLYLTASKLCDPPYPSNEIPIKIKSAFDRLARHQRNWKDEVLEVLRHQSGIILTSEMHNTLNLTSSDIKLRNAKKAINTVMQRLGKEGKVIKPTGRRVGEYRVVSKELTEHDWKNANVNTLNVTLPLGLHEVVRVMPGSILCFAGNPNCGKTAIAMEFSKTNQGNQPIYYYSSETHPIEFKERAEASGENFEKWNIIFRDSWTSQNIQDLVEPNGINVIDYLEPPMGDYVQMANKLGEIHLALKDGIALVFVQLRGENIVGGKGMKEKPHLFCLLEMVNYPVCKMTIQKCKLKKQEYRNPYGLSCEYKVLGDGMSLYRYGKFYFEKRRD